MFSLFLFFFPAFHLSPIDGEREKYRQLTSGRDLSRY